MGRARGVCAVLVALAAQGCAHVAPECATHGGTPWVELTSQHFVVRTNLGADEGRAAAVQLEQVRASELAALPSGQGQPLEVVVFASGAQLQDLSGDPVLDAALTHDWRGPLLLTSSAVSFLGANQLRASLHELAHHFSSGALRRSPGWFEEGLALYLETITLDADAKSAVRGAANQLRLDEVLRWGILPVQSLWAWEGEPDQRRSASSWFWVHFLFNEHRPALDRFMRSLAEGEEPKAAWTAAFGTLAPEVMSREADAYLARRQTRSQKMDLAQLNTALTERVMPDGEVHALLARVAAVAGAWPRARVEARAAIGLDGHDLRALEQNVVTQETAEARVAAARALAEEAPQQATGWLLLGLALPAGDAQRGQALERAVELDPQSAYALSELAAFRCAEGRCSEGAPLAERAVVLAPGDARIHAGAAAVMMKAGQCAKAAVSQQRALEVLPHRASAALRGQLLARLAEYRRCR